MRVRLRVPSVLRRRPARLRAGLAAGALIAVTVAAIVLLVAARSTQAATVHFGPVTPTAGVGSSSSGSPGSSECPGSAALTQVTLTVSQALATAAAGCTALTLQPGAVALTGPPSDATAIGGAAPQGARTDVSACPQSEVVTGFASRSSDVVAGVQVICQHITSAGAPAGAETYAPTYAGGPGGNVNAPIRCPSGDLAVGAGGRTDGKLDYFYLYCAALELNPTATGVSVASSVNPAVFGQGVTFTAALNTRPDGGQVQFLVDGSNFGAPVKVDLAGDATSPPDDSLSPGSHTVAARFTGTADYVAASGTLSQGQTVNRSTTATTLTSNGAQASTGQPVALAATVTVAAPGGGIPSGTVTFLDGGTSIGTASLDHQTPDVATLPLSTLPVGAHTLTATYGGDTDFQSSAPSSQFVQSITPAATSVTVVSSTPSSSFGQPVQLTATVAVAPPGTGTPTGAVNFFANGHGVGSAMLNNANPDQAALSTHDLPVGTLQITAAYQGDTSFGPSQMSAGVPQTVSPARTTLAVSASPPTSSPYNSPVSVTAVISVAPGSAIPAAPTGTLTFSVDGQVVKTFSVQELRNQTATATVGSLSLGPHVVTVAYSGDANYDSSSGSVTEYVYCRVGVTGVITQTCV